VLALLSLLISNITASFILKLLLWSATTSSHTPSAFSVSLVSSVLADAKAKRARDVIARLIVDCPRHETAE
jgi:hypothetical protein